MSAAEKPLHIVALESQNVKRLRAVRITPAGNVVIVGGKNGAGKTSLLDSIMYALAGKKALPEEPLRKGADKGKVVVEIAAPGSDDVIVVTRHFLPDGEGQLVVSTKGGSHYRSPQSFLDGLLGRLSFDPLRFSTMRPAEQLEELKTVLGLDFTELDRQKQGAYDQRRDANAEVRRLEGALDSMPTYEGVPEAETSVETVAEELRAAEETRGRVRALENEALNAHHEAGARRDEAARARTRAEALRQEAAKLDGVAEEHEQRAEAAEERAKGDAQTAADLAQALPDVDAIRERLRDVEAQNEQVRAGARRRELEKALKAAQELASELDGRVKAVDAEKRRLVEQAELPVEGLALGDDEVLLGGLPFTQASQAEQLRVSMAVAIAANPTLRIALLRDASLLDEENLALVVQMAEQKGAQVWLERVGDKDPGAIVIEAGEVRGG